MRKIENLAPVYEAKHTERKGEIAIITNFSNRCHNAIIYAKGMDGNLYQKGDISKTTREKLLATLDEYGFDVTEE